MKKYQVTEWGHPLERLDSQWGTLEYRHWLTLESRRWEDKWREAWIETNSEGLVALFSNADEMQPTDF